MNCKSEIIISKVFYLFLFAIAGCMHPYCSDIISVEHSTIILKPGSEGMDAIVKLGNDSQKNFGDKPTLTEITWNDIKIVPFNNIGFIKFDLKSIPGGAKIEHVTLKLFIDKNDKYFKSLSNRIKFSTNGWTIRGVIEDWDERTISGQKIPMSYGEFLKELPLNSQDLTCSIDVTDLINREYEKPGRYFGFMLMTTLVYEGQSLVNYCSSDHPDSSLHPELIIDYVREK